MKFTVCRIDRYSAEVEADSLLDLRRLLLEADLQDAEFKRIDESLSWDESTYEIDDEDLL